MVTQQTGASDHRVTFKNFEGIAERIEDQSRQIAEANAVNALQQELQKMGLPLPNQMKTKTPNSFNEAVAERVNRMYEMLPYFGNERMQDDVRYLQQLCIILGYERQQMEQELQNWREKVNDLMFMLVKNGCSHYPLGRNMPVEYK